MATNFDAAGRGSPCSARYFRPWRSTVAERIALEDPERQQISYGKLVLGAPVILGLQARLAGGARGGMSGCCCPNIQGPGGDAVRARL